MKSTKNDPEEAADRKWECRRVGATTRWRHDDDDDVCEDQPTAAILFHREEKQSQDIDHR